VAGAGIWNIVLAFLGYFLGNNEKLIHEYSQKISGIVVIIVIVILAGYVIIYKWRKKRGK
jgi:membrane protein DedA with SNARE-associated domain